MRIERRKPKVFLKRQAVKDEREKGKGIRVLIRLSYGNMKEDNKYQVEEDRRRCVFYEEGKNNVRHFRMQNCKRLVRMLGENEREKKKVGKFW